MLLATRCEILYFVCVRCGETCEQDYSSLANRCIIRISHVRNIVRQRAPFNRYANLKPKLFAPKCHFFRLEVQLRWVCGRKSSTDSCEPRAGKQLKRTTPHFAEIGNNFRGGFV